MTPTVEARPERQHRRRVLKGAAIITGVNNSAIACTVRNMHEQGAELRVSPEARVPDRFLLYVPVDGVCYDAILRWRRMDRCGVMFQGTPQPKPRWYYG